MGHTITFTDFLQLTSPQSGYLIVNPRFRTNGGWWYDRMIYRPNMSPTVWLAHAYRRLHVRPHNVNFIVAPRNKTGPRLRMGRGSPLWCHPFWWDCFFFLSFFAVVFFHLMPILTHSVCVCVFVFMCACLYCCAINGKVRHGRPPDLVRLPQSTQVFFFSIFRLLLPNICACVCFRATIKMPFFYEN